MKIDNKLILENSKNLNILYVEDDDLLRESTSQLFRNFFKNVDVSIDGEAGLDQYKDYMKDNDCSYDLVISDINMPNMDGLEMCDKIKEINYDQVIIFITAFNESNYLHSAISLGVNGFLTKPIEMEQLKDVLYRSTQVVVDRKLVQEHYSQIEKQNIHNLDAEQKSIVTSPRDILIDLDRDKENISHKWLEYKVIHERLKSYNIDIEFFRTHYGIKVIEYFLNVIRGKEKVGNCPIIMVMLEFFKNKNLSLEDIFVICVNFKNTITSYLLQNYSFNQKLFDEFSLILDKNFEGVIINFQSKGNSKQEALNPNTNNVQTYSQDKLRKQLFQKKKAVVEVSEEINYNEYVLENDIYELQDLEEEIDALAVLVIMNNSSTIDDSKHLGSQIQRYGVILTNYPLFSKLGEYIVKLGTNFKENSQLLMDDQERMSSITALIEGFVNDLIIWRKEIFENNIDNPHFLDDSFFSNVDTIIMFIEYDESKESELSSSEDDIEFF